MKALIFCGSPHRDGTTAYALSLVAEELAHQKIDTDMFYLGSKPVRGCIGCRQCRDTHRCIFTDDTVNDFIERLEDADALVLGAPTYFFGAAGQAHAFLDRVFYASSQKARAHKPAAVLAVARRAGAVPAVDNLLKFPLICEMPVVSSCYLPVMFGNRPEEAVQDEEGVRIMRTLGRNLAWIMQSLEAARAAGVCVPEALPAARTNFIR